jgi:hypothetical protein
LDQFESQSAEYRNGIQNKLKLAIDRFMNANPQNHTKGFFCLNSSLKAKRIVLLL